MNFLLERTGWKPLVEKCQFPKTHDILVSFYIVKCQHLSLTFTAVIMKSATSKITSSWEFDISKNKAIDIPVWLGYDSLQSAFFKFCSCWFVGGVKMSYLQKLFLFTVNEREFFFYGSYRCRSSRLQRLLNLREQLVDSL